MRLGCAGLGLGAPRLRTGSHTCLHSHLPGTRGSGDPRWWFQSQAPWTAGGESEISPPSGGRGQLPTPPAVTMITVEVKTVPLALIPGCCTCSLPLGWGLHSRALGLTLGSRLRGLPCRRKNTRWSDKQHDSRSGPFNPAEYRVRVGVRAAIWWGEDWISNFWSHYKTLFFIRIEYHLKSLL